MYNFKKKKTYQYDHAYGHEMFQRGKIELLRNIHRKSAESTQLIPTNFAEDAQSRMQKQTNSTEINVDDLLQENLEYKRVQKALITQLQFVEKKVKDIKLEINTLHQESQQQGVKEDFLKKVIKKLSECFGSANIRYAIEAATEEVSPVYNNAQSTYPARREETYITRTNNNMANVENNMENNVFQPYSVVNINNCGNISLPDQQVNESFRNKMEEKPMKMTFGNYVKESSEECEKIEWNDHEEVFTSQETDARVDPSRALEESDSNESKFETYLNWHTEFEKRIRNADSFLDGNERDVRGLDLDITPRSALCVLSEGIF
jgi:hypothetical protein